MKVSPGDHPGELVLWFNAPDLVEAHERLEESKFVSPPGYVWISETLRRPRKPDGSSNGQKCDVTLVIRHVTNQHHRLSPYEYKVLLFGEGVFG